MTVKNLGITQRKVKNSILSNVNPMTLIIGVRCKEGVVLAIDMRSIKGAEHIERVLLSYR